MIAYTGLISKDVSRLTGVSESDILAIKAGRVTPTLDTVMKIADGLHISLDYIYGRADVPFGDRYSDRGYFLRAVYDKAAMTERVRRAKAGELPPEQEIAAYYKAKAYDVTAPWPHNLIEALFGRSEMFDPARAIPVDCDMGHGIRDALDSLNARERRVIYGIYRDNASLNDLGEELGITKERVRQIRELALRKLRHPSNAMPMLYGHSWAAARTKRRLAEKELKAAELDLERAEEARDNTKAILSEIGVDNAESLPFADLYQLDLSVRTYNALVRSGITTMGGLISFYNKNGREGLMKIRNLGRKSLDEVMEKLDGMPGVKHFLPRCSRHTG